MKSKDNSKLWDDDQKDYWTKSWQDSTTTIEEITDKARNSQLILPSILKYTPKGSKVLEAGCGRGQWVIRGFSTIFDSELLGSIIEYNDSLRDDLNRVLMNYEKK